MHVSGHIEHFCHKKLSLGQYFSVQKAENPKNIKKQISSQKHPKIKLKRKAKIWCFS